MHRPHQRRTLSIVQNIEPGELLQAETAVPQASRIIDGVIHLQEASSGWGVIRESLSHRIVIIEHYSRPPSIRRLVTARAKLGWMVDQWWQRREKHGQRPPLLLVLSGGQPRKALGWLPAFGPRGVRGVWATAPSIFGDVLLVDVKGLEKRDGTSILRLMHAPDSSGEARERIEDVLTDRGIEDKIRESLVEGIMQGTVELTADEREVTYRSVLEHGREEGREEGREKGREEGREEGRREALLQMAARVGGEQLREELATLDINTLEARVMELLR